jgi:sugar phosphate permease
MDACSPEEVRVPPPSALAVGKQSLRRRWFYLLPAVFVTYSLAYLDRANFGFGAAAGLAATLHITGQQTSLLGSLFFLGYLLFQMPGAIFAKKRSATRLVFIALIAWGSLAALTGVIRIFWLLALDRFLLGVAESTIFPAMLLLLTRWFTRAERSRANTILILGNPITVLWMSAITGYLIQAYGWQRTFVIEGIPSVVWAVIWIVLVRDKPSQAKWMTPEGVEVLEAELAREQLTVAPVGAVRQALLRADILLISTAFFFWSIGVYGFVLWLPTMVQQGGSLSMGKTGLLSALPYLLSISMMLVVSHFSDRSQKRQALVWPLLCLAGIALLGSFLFAAHSFPLAFVCLVLAGGCMYAPYGPFWAMVPERVPANVCAEVLAYINTFGACGGLFGSYFVGLLRAITGDSRAGYLLMSLSLVCAAIIVFILKKPHVVPASVSPAAR